MLVTPARAFSRLGAHSFSSAAAAAAAAGTASSAATGSLSAYAAPASPSNAHAWVALEYVYAARDAAELATKRAPLRAAHLAHAAAAPALELGGAFAPSAAPAAQGGLLLFRTADAAAVEHFARSDPYFTGGLVASFTVRPWAVVIDKRALPC